MNFGANYFGVMHDFYRDFEGSLKRLAESGINTLEICLYPDNQAQKIQETYPPQLLAQMDIPQFAGVIWRCSEAKEKIEKIRAYGITVQSAHLQFPLIGTQADAVALAEEVAAFAESSGMRYFVASPMCGLSELKKRAPWLQAVAKEFRDRGIYLLVHNHSMECKQEEDTTGIEYVMDHCPDLFAEPDVGWMYISDMNPVPFLEKYSDRVIHLHLKDFYPGKTPQDGSGWFAPIGEGILPLREVLEAAKACSISEYGVIIDQDASAGDFIADLKTGVENMIRNS